MRSLYGWYVAVSGLTAWVSWLVLLIMNVTGGVERGWFNGVLLFVFILIWFFCMALLSALDKAEKSGAHVGRNGNSKGV